MDGRRSTAPLEMSGVDLDRGGRPVLRGVTASFERERVTAIVGPSGAGKTSLLRCLNRLEEPRGGSVLLDGADVRTLDPQEVRKRVGMIFQTPVIFDGDVRANLGYGLNGVPAAQLEAALEASALSTSFMDRDASALSVGQAQRVCIARALVRSPEVLLMDEPTSSLDKDAARRVEELMSSLARRGLAVVVVTHDLAQAGRVAEEGLLLVDGRVVAAGAIPDLERAWPEAPK
jgi:putative ABC transport system ATP-binding protein